MTAPVRRITLYRLATDASGQRDYADLADRLGISAEAEAVRQTIDAFEHEGFVSVRPDGTVSVSPAVLRRELETEQRTILLRLLGYEATDVEGIAKRHGIAGGSAHVARTGTPVWEIVRAYRAGGERRSAVYESCPDLREADVSAALEYYETHQDEIDQDILDEEAVDLIYRGMA